MFWDPECIVYYTRDLRKIKYVPLKKKRYPEKECVQQYLKIQGVVITTIIFSDVCGRHCLGGGGGWSFF